ncbi:MAG: hypothetical protein ACFFCS_20375 [Candidatus Hodarchaeota archaeon]
MVGKPGDAKEFLQKTKNELMDMLRKRFTQEMEKKLENIKAKRVKDYIIAAFEGKKEILDEIEKYKKLQKKFGVGVFFWLDKTPIMKGIIEEMMGRRIDNFLDLSAKKAIDEFYSFIDNVKKVNETLYQQEIASCREEFLEKSILPGYISHSDDYALSYIHNQFIQIFPRLNGGLKKIATILNGFLSYMKSKLDTQFKLFEEMDEFIQKIKASNFSFDGQEKYMNEFQQRSTLVQNTFKSDFKSFNEEQMRKIKDLHNEMLGLSSEVNSLVGISNKIIRQNKEVEAKKYTNWVEKCDSFNIHFTKLLNRLFFIQKHNNRDFLRDRRAFFKVNSEDLRVRTKLKDLFLEGEFKTEYSNLKNYILSIFNLNSLRVINAHQTPNSKISIDEKSLKIPRIGRRTDKVVDLEELKVILSTYSFFILSALYLLNNA